MNEVKSFLAGLAKGLLCLTPVIYKMILRYAMLICDLPKISIF